MPELRREGQRVKDGLIMVTHDPNYGAAGRVKAAQETAERDPIHHLRQAMLALTHDPDLMNFASNVLDLMKMINEKKLVKASSKDTGGA